MPLIILLIFVTVGISGCAAFFSVYGLAHIFSSAFISTIFMGGFLEAGKLVAASFLYRYWVKLGLFLKTYLVFAVIGLMIITSIGIFGYLSAAYQTDTIELKENNQRIELLTQEKTSYESRLSNIDVQIKNVPDAYVSKKIQLIKQLNEEKKDILGKLNGVTEERTQLMSKKLTTEAKVGPIIFIANAMGRSADDATVYLIVIIMSVFDPLAVALTIAINVAIKDRQSTKIEKPKEIEKSEPDTNPLDDISSRLDQLSNSNNKRNDIIDSMRSV
jgi:hypothetical protein